MLGVPVKDLFFKKPGDTGDTGIFLFPNEFIAKFVWSDRLVDFFAKNPLFRYLFSPLVSLKNSGNCRSPTLLSSLAKILATSKASRSRNREH